MKRTVIVTMLVTAVSLGAARAQSSFKWPELTSLNKPWVRWWWPGNAVDTPGLRYNLEAFAKAGIGGTEITPIYGVKGFDSKDIDFLSDKWMGMLKYVIKESGNRSMGVDMATGTGWPFGGPRISPANAAAKAIFQTYHLQGGSRLTQPVVMEQQRQRATAKLQVLMAYPETGKPLNLTGKLDASGHLDWTAPPGSWTLIAAFSGNTFQQVKRSSPGGEGLVIDHFSTRSLDTYLEAFTTAFKKNNCPVPHAFFNDSYEVYGADWTPGLFSAFRQQRGYNLEDYLPALMGQGNPDTVCRVIQDYRETISELLRTHFTLGWTRWAHTMGSITRNQAHGSPGNLLDLYGTVDIPEIESYGSSHFDVPGVPEDSLGDRAGKLDPLLLKFASSAAHVMGKQYASSETFTWLGEHFRVSLSECKPVLDEMLVSGINHVLFHGSPYSPKGAPWPGWQFYASVDFSPYNTFWHDIPAFNRYIGRAQSFLQKGKPDNDVLLYWPIQDVFAMNTGSMLYQLTIGGATQWLSPTPFHQVASRLMDQGYSFDYISDLQLDQTKIVDGELRTPGATYHALVVPPCRYMPLATLEKISLLAKAGAKVIFMDQLPGDVPGLDRLIERRKSFERLKDSLGGNRPFTNYNSEPYGKGRVLTGGDVGELMQGAGITASGFPAEHVDFIRRKEDGGYIYFLTNLHAKAVDAWIPLSRSICSAVFYDPYSGRIGTAALQTIQAPRARGGRGSRQPSRQQVYLQLKPGQSLIMEAYTDKQASGTPWHYTEAAGAPYQVSGIWKIAFEKGMPHIAETFQTERLASWTTLNDSARVFAGTARYTLSFDLPKAKADDWLLSLGQVDFSADVTINGKPAGSLWGVPFSLHVGSLVHPGKNTLEVAVTNLAANRIAEYDRKKIPWKIFKDINVVTMSYKPFDASGWYPVSSGLLGPVTLTPLRAVNPQ
jgi:hypothetical protein